MVRNSKKRLHARFRACTQAHKKKEHTCSDLGCRNMACQQEPRVDSIEEALLKMDPNSGISVR